MIKVFIYVSLLLNVGVFYGSDEYTVILKDETQSSGIQEIKAPKKILDLFYAIKTTPISSNTFDFSNRSYTVSAFELAVDIAYIISDGYAAQDETEANKIIDFSIKSKIAKALQENSVDDVLGCANIFFSLGGPESIQRLMDKESVRLIKKFMLQGGDQTITLGDVDVTKLFETLKNEIINIFATSDEIIDFSKNNVHLDLTGTQDKEINHEVMVPRGTLYAYTTGYEQPIHLFNVTAQKKIDYKLPTHALPNTPVAYALSLYAARLANKIAGVTPYNVVLLFSDDESVNVKFGVSSRDVVAFSEDGKLFLRVLVIESLCFLEVYDLVKGLIVYSTRVAYISRSRQLRGCFFNPDDSNIFGYYTNEQMCISDENHLHKPMILKDFDGEIIKAAFSDDGSYIYVLIWKENSLTCYRYHYLEPAGKISIQHPSNELEVLNTINSADNEQLFVECSYNSGKNPPYPLKSYDLVRFDFGEGIRKPSAQNLYIGAEQKFDVRLLDNLIVYKAKDKIHFYDCFFHTQPLPPLGLDKCRSILGFSADGSLWLRMDPGAADIRGVKKAEEYLISYNLRKKQLLNDIIIKVNANLGLNDCLELLTENKKNKRLWYENAYATINKVDEKDKQGLRESIAYAKAYEKALKSQLPESDQAKAIREAEEALQESQRIRAQQLETTKKIKVIQKAKARRKNKEEQMESGQILAHPQITPPPPTPPTMLQRAWNAAKSAGQGFINFVTTPFRWISRFFGWA